MTLLEALRELQVNGPTCQFVGICECVRDILVTHNNCISHKSMSEQLDDMVDLFPRWPQFSGSFTYPVPSGDHNTPFGAYIKARRTGMWDRDRPYGALRWELLDFMITELEKDLER